MDEGYYWQRINYFTDNPVPRVVRWHLEIQQKEGSIRNLTFTPKANKTQTSYEGRCRVGPDDSHLALTRDMSVY